MLITRQSMFTSKVHTLDVPCTEEQLREFESGTTGRPIQDIMPNVPLELREFIMTGVTPQEWTNTFSHDFVDDYLEDDE